MSYRPTHQPVIGNTAVDTGEALVLNVRGARQQAELADSIAARAEALAERLQERAFAPLTAADEANDYRHRATYAAAVRDTLQWLTGAKPADRLTDTLDLDPED